MTAVWVARALLPLAVLAAGCTVPVAAGIDDSDANRIVVALDRVGIDAVKDIDPLADGRFRVDVPRDDAARAITTLQSEGLPRPKPAGVLDAFDKGALVPSRAAEHAAYVAGVAGDLQQTLEGVDGVLHARVHLNLADPDPLRDAPPAKATASILVEHRGATPPLASADVQRLVAGGVAGLAPADVTVVFVPHAPLPADPSPLAHVGPIAVARASVRLLQLTLAALVALVAGLSAFTLVLYARLGRQKPT